MTFERLDKFTKFYTLDDGYKTVRLVLRGTTHVSSSFVAKRRVSGSWLY